MKITTKNIISLAQAVLAIVMLILFCAAPAVKFSIGAFGISASETFTAPQAWLGSDGGDASFGGVMTLIFVILLIVAPIAKFVLEFCLKNTKFSAIINFVIIALSALTAIFLFCGATGLMINLDSTDGFSLAAGAIINAILAIFFAASAVIDQFVLKK